MTIQPEKPLYTSCENYTLPEQTMISASTSGSYSEIVPGLSTRSPFDKRDYEKARPDVKLPTNFSDILVTCRNAYKTKSIVRQVIDLQIDFVTEGFDLSHPNKKIQTVLNSYINQIGLRKDSEEYVKHLIQDHNVVVRRVTSRLTPGGKKRLIELMAAADENFTKDHKSFNKTEIPSRYVFVDPANLSWGKENQGVLSLGDRNKLYYNLDIGKINNIYGGRSKKLPASVSLSPEVEKAISKSGGSNKISVPLDMSKIHFEFIKKDSWEPWALPALYSVLPDIMLKDKIKQMEFSIVDGATNRIRLWKLGDHENDFMPTPAQYERLNDILQANTGNGTLDIIWDDMIDVQELTPDVKKLMSPEKYHQVDKDIMIGLGVPEVLLGGTGSNFSNSFIQLKTLVEKLQDVRAKLTRWFEGELKFICSSLGINELPSISFTNMITYDENVYRQLAIQLHDRGIISTESILEEFEKSSDVEFSRLREEREIFESPDTEKLVKHGPFDQSVPDDKEQENSDSNNEENGRPPNTKDVGKRNRGGGSLSGSQVVHASRVTEFTNSTIMSWYLNKQGLSNARKLSSEERENVESLVICVLGCINNIEDVTESWIIDKIDNLELNTEFVNDVRTSLQAVQNSTYQERKGVQSLILARMLSNA